MTKKEYLVKILEKLESVWDAASALKTVVKEGALGDDVIDVLITAVESGIHSAKSEVVRIKMKKGLDSLERMKQMEKQSSLQDEKELTELDNLINNF